MVQITDNKESFKGHRKKAVNMTKNEAIVMIREKSKEILEALPTSENQEGFIRYLVSLTGNENSKLVFNFVKWCNSATTYQLSIRGKSLLNRDAQSLIETSSQVFSYISKEGLK